MKFGFCSKVVASKLDYLETQIDKLNKRAKRLGLEPITWEIKKRLEIVCSDKNRDTYNSKGQPVRILFWIEFWGESPILDGGWTFQATLQHTEAGNLINCAPQATSDFKEYRHVGPKCDHCNTERQRKNTYLLCDKDGNVMQLASKCIKDFLGHKSLSNIAWVASFEEILEELEKPEPLSFGGGFYIPPTIEEFMPYVVMSYETRGWISSRDWARTSTCTDAFNHMDPPKDLAKDVRIEMMNKPTDAHKDKAKEIIKWAKSLQEREDLNEFLFKLSVLFQSVTIPERQAATTAAAVIAYEKEMERELIRAKRKNSWTQKCEKSDYVGIKGERTEFSVKVDGIRGFASGYSEDATIYNFVDNNGNQFVWFSSHDINIEEGQEIVLKATIKDHQEYKGLKQTILTRCKLIEQEGKK